MKKRPTAITVISWLFIAVGAAGFISGLLPFAQRLAESRRNPWELISVETVRLLGIIAGAFMLRGRNWARWLLVCWLAFHVGISAFHTVQETIVHAILMAVVLWFLFRPSANDFLN